MNPINRCPQTIVDQGDLTNFMSGYVSLFTLAGEHGQAMKAVKRRLLAAGIQPAFDPVDIGAIFYRRDGIPTNVLTQD